MLRQFFEPDQNPALDAQIDAVLDEMQKIGVKNEKYAEMMTYLERLYELKAPERRKPISLDTMAIVAGNLLGILTIVAYEQKHIMTPKGLAQLVKPKTPQLGN
jgi:hypothetical protein